MRQESNGEVWLTISEAIEFSKKVLLEDRGIDRGYSEWRLRQLAKAAISDPANSLIKARKEVGPIIEIEQASFREWLNKVAVPHAPHASYDKTLPGGRVIIIHSVKEK